MLMANCASRGRLGRLGRDGVALDSAGARQVAALLDSFFTADIPSIDNPRDLAKRMAAKARLLRDGIDRMLDQEGINRSPSRSAERLP